MPKKLHMTPLLNAGDGGTLTNKEKTMSGSSGGGIGGHDESIECDLLGFEAQLTSPQPAAVAKLRVGDVLEIAVATMRGQVVVQALKDDTLVGGLTGPDATKLRNCIGEGHQYSATVQNVNGGQVRVRVSHVR
ncbi:MAG: hypothetical protein NDI84_05885 [Steroidobacteraceae bacterium]|nr:hypothetical protein [Steroidobacteraceae bacterium]